MGQWGWVGRGAVFVALWGAWTGVAGGSWAFGVPAVIVATWISWRLRGEGQARLRPWEVMRFSVYFVSASVRGGLDVAWRAIAPGMPMQPGFVEYPLRMSVDSAAAVFFANIISLLPGTLSVRLGEHSVMVHAIDLRPPVEDELSALEVRVARAFGEPLKEGP
ncbi:cation transporter [Lujinxingia litoralis]|uniref:Cation transporter n=1 Tax=Lujinxingia litoralis TaxID=2211119 RepID=A0A328C9J0_9DELT|nr:Na+/H+ antiporter subunit E [Lujinxingia litoralis]RAL25297.1 cation transporter [Lujinxingia litoralis]